MNNSRKLRQYLLGELSVEERMAMEDRYIADESAFQELVDCENHLVDSYVRGLLSKGQSKRFEAEYCKSPERLARVEFAAALDRACANARRAGPGAKAGFVWVAMRDFLAQPRWFAWATSAAALALIAGCAWLWLGHRAPGNSVQSARAAPAQHRQSEPRLPAKATEAPLVSDRNNGSAAEPELGASGLAIAVLTLAPGMPRGEGSAEPAIVLSSKTRSVDLRLKTSGEYSRCDADVRTAEGQTIGSFHAMSAGTNQDRQLVVVRMPASAVPAGDYIVELRGIGNHGKSEQIEVYAFRALRPRAE